MSAPRRLGSRSRHNRRLQMESLEARHLMAGLNMGGITAGSISAPAEIDDYTFSAAAGDLIDLVLTSTGTSGNFLSFAELFDPLGNRHTFFGVNDGGQRITLPQQAGTYRLSVFDAQQDATGNYTIGAERINPISPNPVALVPGAIANGTIGNVIEKDQFTFQATGLSTIDLVLTSQATGGTFNGIAELFAPSGDRVTFFRTVDGGQRIVLPEETGTYLLMVYDLGYDGTGTYRVGFEGINPISPAPQPLVMGSITYGNTFNAIEKDQFIFHSDGLTTIDLVLTSTARQGSFDAFAELFAPSGTRVTFFRASDGGQRIPLPDEAGDYLLMVYDLGHDGIGNYQVGFEGLAPFSPAPTPVRVGGITNGFTRTIEKDQLAFTAAGLSTIELVMTSTPTQGNYEAIVELFAPSGDRVTFFRGLDGNQRITLPDESGQYVLMVYDIGYDGAGNYSIGMEGLHPISPNPRALVRNATTAGEISRTLEKDQLVLRGINNETIQLQLTGIAIDAGFEAFAELFAPSGERVAFFRPIDGLQNIPLTGFGTGNYLLQVRSIDLAKRGSYQVAFNGSPLPSAINAPTNLRVANLFDNRAVIAWNQNSNNEVGFQIAVSFDQGESFVTVGTTTIDSTSFTIQNLIPGQRYQVKVRAFNNQDVSPYSNVIDVVTRLRTPTNLRASNLTANSVLLSWNDNSNNETRFEIFRRVGTSGAFTRVFNTAANATTFNATNLTPGTTYQFYVRAVKTGSASLPSNILTITTASSLTTTNLAALVADSFVVKKPR